MPQNHTFPTRLPPIEVQATETGYQLICKALGLSCTAASLEAGYAALSQAAATHTANDITQNDARKANIVTIKAETYNYPPQVKSSNFSKVAGIIILVAMVPLGLLTLSILNDARVIIRNVRSLTTTVASGVDNAPALARSTSDFLDHAATMATRLTPERQEQMSRDIAVISEKLAPLAASARPLFEAVGLAPPSDESPEPTAPARP